MAERERKPVASNDLIAGAKYEWAKTYKTDIQESRLRKELGPLGNEKPSEVLLSFVLFVRETPVKFFSWNKWRDTWRAYLVSAEDSRASKEETFSKLLASPAGYAPAVGVYWTIPDIRNKFGDSAAAAVEKIGGVARLQNMTTDQKKWVEKAFVEAYG